MNEVWHQVILESQTPEINEAISNFMFELGASGVSENGPQFFGYFNHADIDGLRVSLSNYLESLQEIVPSFRVPKLTISEVVQENWAEMHRPYFTPQKIGRNFYFLPPWEAVEKTPPGRIPLIIEPGQAFGTGLHPSTQLSLKQIEKSVYLNLLPEPYTLLDVGTGTGILSIAASLLGFEKITAIDVDPLAIEAVEQNLEFNQTHNIEASQKNIQELQTPYSIIVSNILLETHLELLPEYVRLLRPKGKLILAGLLNDQFKAIMPLCLEQGLVLEERIIQEDWLSLRFYKV
jgi:ribosomal protein L11 methyltransferase